MSEDKSSWAIGGGIIGGLGVGMLLQSSNPMAIVGFMLLGLGLGLVTTSVISRNTGVVSQ